MSSNLYDSLPQGLREVLDQMGESEVANQIYADLAKQQAKVYAEKEKAKEAVEKFKSEFTKAKQKKTMTTSELKQGLTSLKKSDLVYLIEELMESGVIDIADITLCHTRALESKLAAKDKVIFEADKCIFESVFADSLGKPSDNAALLRKLEWMEKTGMHNMDGIMEYLTGAKK